jgi:hypothetical protein
MEMYPNKFSGTTRKYSGKPNKTQASNTPEHLPKPHHIKSIHSK